MAPKTSPQQLNLLHSFSLLLLGATLSTLATLNFSLALVIGILCAPLNFIRPLPRIPSRAELDTKDDLQTLAYSLAIALTSVMSMAAVSPPVILFALNGYLGKGTGWMLAEMAKGWTAQGVWTGLVVWGVWWPAWVLSGCVLISGTMRKNSSA